MLAIDARGFGETRPGGGEATRGSSPFGDYNSAMTALLIGKSLPGMRAQDISRAVDLLSSRPEVDREKIYGFGKDGGAVPMLYAAVLDPRIRRVALERMLASYEAVASQRMHRQVFEQIVAGALRHYDIPEMIASLAPRTVSVISTVDALGRVQPGRGTAAALLAR